MNIRFDGKRAVVTGAGKGIGRDLAKALNECGADTFALSRTQSDLDSLKAEVPGIHVYQVDLSDWGKTRALIESICPVDLLVNNAAVAKLDSIIKISPEMCTETMDTNVKAVINMSQVVATDLIERGKEGAIVNISSICSQTEIGDSLGMYSASKAALDSLTKTLARELGPFQIRCNSVNPTGVLTNMSREYLSEPANAKPLLDRTPMGKFAEVKDIVNPTLYLLSDKADMITGTILNVDGGLLAS